MNQPSYRVTCGAVPNPQWSTQNFLSLDATNKRLNQTTADNSINLYLLNDLTTAANVDHGNDPEAVEPAAEEACGPQLVGQLLSAHLCPGRAAAMLRM